MSGGFADLAGQHGVEAPAHLLDTLFHLGPEAALDQLPAAVGMDDQGAAGTGAVIGQGHKGS